MGNKNNPPATGYEPVPLPGFDSLAGAGFVRFIKTRWPRSDTLPRGDNESEDSFQQRDRMAIQAYEEWLRKIFSQFLEIPDHFVLPYGILIVPDYPPIYNFPPNSCRLKYPMNTGGAYSQDNGPFRQKFDPGAIYSDRFDWNDQWNYIERAFPYDLTKNKENFLYQPQDQNPLDDDIEKIKDEWKAWFRETWPNASFMGDFNQTDEDIASSIDGNERAYEDWVDLNFTKFWSRYPDDKYWNWPLPYDIYPFDGSVPNKPPLQCQLKYGYRRTQTIIGLTPSSPPFPLGSSSYEPLWVSMFYNLNIGSLSVFKRASENVEALSGDFQHINVIDCPYKDPQRWKIECSFQDIGNFWWGPGGKIGRRYPMLFPQRYPLDVPLYNYGALNDWPDPYDMITDIPLIPSAALPFPPQEVLEYWRDLILTFSKKNPRLYVPYFSILSTPIEKKNYQTDRFGFKMFPEGTSPFAYDTSDMEVVDSLYIHHRSVIDSYLFSFCEKLLEKYGIFKDPSFIHTNEYDRWSRAVLQAVHLRYAERHHFYPWEKFSTSDTSRSHVWPHPQVIDQLALDYEFEFEWPSWVWADNFLSLDQKKAYKTQKAPSDFKPLESEILPWPTLIYILKTLQDRRNKGSGDSELIETKHLDDNSIRQFGLFVWHTRQPALLKDSEIVNPTENLYLFLKNACGLSTTSSYDTWNRALSYLLNNMYHSIVLSPSQVSLKKLGQCIIDPTTSLSEKCIEYIIPEEDDPYGDFSGDEYSLCWELWRQQWYQTEGRLDWPTYAIDEDGNIIMLDNSEPVPGFWQKFLNTLVPRSPPAAIGVQPGSSTRFVKGFILPRHPKGVYSTKIITIYNFMRNFGMPIIRQKPPSIFLTASKWTSMKSEQWASYKEWVESNIIARDSEYYASPHSHLRDRDGAEILFGNQQKKMINCYPSFGVFPTTSQVDFSFIWNPGEWADNVFGIDYLWASLEELAGQVITLVTKTLRDLASVLGIDLWKLILLGGAVIAGVGIMHKTIDRLILPGVNPQEIARESLKHKRKRDYDRQFGA